MQSIKVAFIFQQFILTITSWRISILVAALTQFCVAFCVQVKKSLYSSYYFSGEINKGLTLHRCSLFRAITLTPQSDTAHVLFGGNEKFFEGCIEMLSVSVV